MNYNDATEIFVDLIIISWFLGGFGLVKYVYEKQKRKDDD